MAVIGILALQGGFSCHARQLDRCGVAWRLIKTPQQLKGLSGLIMPGGESSALLKLMAPIDQWQSAVADFIHRGGVLFATCAGLILSADTVCPKQASLSLLPVTVERNAYGRQRESFVAQGQCHEAALSDQPIEMVMIRAPRITQCGEGVRVLVSYQGEPMMVQSGQVIAASFHPELSQSTTVHEYFCQQAGITGLQSASLN